MLGAPDGAGPGYRRPIVIVQANDFTESRIATIIAVVVTTNIGLAQAPGNIFLSKRISQLPQDSVINVSQLLTLDKRFVTERVSLLPSHVIERIDAGLRLVLAL